MKLRNTIILVVVFVALAAYAYYLTRNPSAASTAQTTPVPTPVSMFNFTSDQVTKFVVTDLKNKQTVSVTHQGQNWHMDQPKDSPTDSIKILGTIANISHLDASRVITGTSDLAQFGLTSPSIEAQLTLSDTTQAVLRIGDATVDQQNYYAQKGNDPQVYLIASSIEQSLADYIKNPPYPPTPTPTPLPTLTPTATPVGATPEPTATPTP
ncbi:MAG: DUF4340 domain-containing protein [Rudaea sp.]